MIFHFVVRSITALSLLLTLSACNMLDSTSTQSPSPSPTDPISAPTPSTTPSSTPTPADRLLTEFNNRWIPVPNSEIGTEKKTSQIDSLSLSKRKNRITFTLLDGEGSLHKMRAVCRENPDDRATIEILETNGKQVNAEPSERIPGTLPGEALLFVCKTYTTPPAPSPRPSKP